MCQEVRIASLDHYMLFDVAGNLFTFYREPEPLVDEDKERLKL